MAQLSVPEWQAASKKAKAAARQPTAIELPAASQATKLPTTHSQAGGTSHCTMGIMAATKIEYFSSRVHASHNFLQIYYQNIGLGIFSNILFDKLDIPQGRELAY